MVLLYIIQRSKRHFSYGVRISDYFVCGMVFFGKY